VLPVQFGDPGFLPPVPVGGVRPADLVREAFQRIDPGGDAGFRE